MMQEGDRQHAMRKRKSKVAPSSVQTPNLHIPLDGSHAIVPVGLVNSRVNQLDASAEQSGESMIEILKKQKRGNTTPNATSAAATPHSPRRAP